MRLGLMTLGIASLLLTGCDDIYGGWNQAQEDFHYSYPLKAGGRLEVQNQNGPVEISGWDQSTVDISGTKYAPDTIALREVKIDIVPTASAVSVRTMRSDIGWQHGSVRYVIRVPRGVELDRIATSNGPIKVDDVAAPAHLHTSNGPVRATGMKGSIEVETSNGPVNITDAAGPATIRTSNGPIELSLDSIGQVRATTSNGPITLRIPSGANAELRANTSHGPITTDFNLLTSDLDRHHVEGRIGGGGPLLDLSTSNGPIRVLRR